MKWILKLLAVAFMLQSFQCTNDRDNNQTIEPLTQEFQYIKKQEITNYVNSFNCLPTIGCSAIAFGSKACGGPKEYLLYPNNIDVNKLKQLVSDYNAFENTYNIQTSAISDCAVVTAPANIDSINGVCTVL